LVHYNSENVNAVRDKSCKINARFPGSFVRRLGKPAPFLTSGNHASAGT